MFLYVLSWILYVGLFWPNSWILQILNFVDNYLMSYIFLLNHFFMFMFVAYFNFFLRVRIIVIIILVTSFCYRTTVLFLDVDEFI